MKINLEISQEEYDALPPNHPLRQLSFGVVSPPVAKPVFATPQEKTIADALTPEEVRKIREQDQIRKFLFSYELPMKFMSLSTPYYAAVKAINLEKQLISDETLVYKELVLAGARVFNDNVDRCDPCILAIHRAIPNIVGIVPGYVLYRYAACWVAFQNTTDFTQASIRTIQELGLVFHNQKTLTAWVTKVKEEHAEAQRKPKIGQYCATQAMG